MSTRKGKDGHPCPICFFKDMAAGGDLDAMLQSAMAFGNVLGTQLPGRPLSLAVMQMTCDEHNTVYLTAAMLRAVELQKPLEADLDMAGVPGVPVKKLSQDDIETLKSDLKAIIKDLKADLTGGKARKAGGEKAN